MLADERWFTHLNSFSFKMTEPEAVEFVFAGAVAGQPVSASQGVPFTRFIEFNNDVQSYVQGSDNKTVLHDVKVQVHEGSYLLRVLLPIGLLPSLLADTAKLATATTLSDIDENRARIVLRWQERAKMEPSLTYTVRSPSGAFSPVIISKDSNLLRPEKIVWVDVERYVIGEITDWGGAQNPNVHIRLRNSRETIIVASTEEQIRDQRENLVFHKAIVHLRAKQNPKTSEVDRSSYKLLALRAYKTDVEDARLQQLFEKGAKAWADIPEAAAWVEELRGGYHG
jgi:hypothetical protein